MAMKRIDPEFYLGLSTDRKPGVSGENVKAFFEMDTCQFSFAMPGAYPSEVDVSNENVCSVTPNTINDIQALHDQLVVDGGGKLVFKQGDYVPSAPATINSGFVGINFSGSDIDIAAIGNGTWLSIQNSLGYSDRTTPWMNRKIANGRILATGFNAASVSGPTALRFDSPTALTSNRLFVEGVSIMDTYNAVSFGSRSYFVKFVGLTVRNSAIGLLQTAAPTDFTEKNAFMHCLFADNGTHVQDLGGQVWYFLDTSFDYHQQRAFDLQAGSKAILVASHIEWDYGLNAGETNNPIKLTGSASGFFMRGGVIVSKAGGNPNYEALFETNSQDNYIDVDVDKVTLLGRTGNATHLDSLVKCTGAISPQVRFRARVAANSVNDCPAMTWWGESAGSAGLTRWGIANPFLEINHRTAVSGTAAIASVSIDENGVTRKNAQPMLKITGAGKVMINLPIIEPMRRHAWCFFYNSAFVTGSFTVKERVSGYAAKFDGTTVTMTPHGEGAVYSGVTVTGTNATGNTWQRCSWKNCNSGHQPGIRHNLNSIVQIEIDTTLMTAGALYLSYIGFDLM